MNKLTLTVIASLLIVILTACGSSPAQTEPEPAPATETVSQPTETPTTEAAPATEAPVTEAPATEAAATEAAASTNISFAAQVKPIFDNKCIKCHGIDSVKEGLDMRTYESIMAGSFNGAVIIPGDAANSFAVQEIVDGEMPKRGPKVTPEELQLIIDWVNQGAQNN